MVTSGDLRISTYSDRIVLGSFKGLKVLLRAALVGMSADAELCEAKEET
jgi:hypothetical protein